MSAGEIDDAAASKKAARPSSNFPRFVEFFAGQTPGAADRASDAVEKRVAGESRKIVFGEARLAAGVEVTAGVRTDHAIRRRRPLICDAAKYTAPKIEVQNSSATNGAFTGSTNHSPGAM